MWYNLNLSMSIKTQASKNLKLSEKLAQFLVNHPKATEKFPKNASFVTFSAQDKNLNKVNKQLINELLEEGKKVIKAEETNDRKLPWRFTAIAS